jgi:hypothetical protein
VTDKTDTFAGKNCNIGAIKRLDGTEMYLNAAGRDDRLRLGILSHRSIVFDCNHGSSGRALRLPSATLSSGGAGFK